MWNPLDIKDAPQKLDEFHGLLTGMRQDLTAIREVLERLLVLEEGK